MELRDYQSEAIEALEAGWDSGLQRLGVSLPTGTGKTAIMSHLAHRRAAGRVLITVHREELVTQTVDNLRQVDDSVSIGVVKAQRNQGGAAIVVASIQTLARPARLAQIGTFGLVIVDEAHRSMSDSYQRVLRDINAPRVVGFTATWSRSDSKGLGDYWEKIVFTRSMRWAIAHGFLVKPVGKRIITDLDLSRVKKSAGDYTDSSLGTAMTDESIRDAIAKSYAEHASNRQGVLFAPTVASAQFFAAGLRDAGFATEGLYGTTNSRESAAVHQRYREGRTQILATCTRLAEGWDAPWCSAAIMARPTLHNGLFIQQVGRVLRLHPGKADALVLDVVGTTDNNGLTAEIDLSETPVPRESEDWDVEDRLEQDDEAPEKVRHHAELVGIADVDLFAQSRGRWLTTDRGVPFLRTTEHTYFIWPSGTQWSVGRCGAYSLAGGEWLMHGDDVEMLMLWADESAVGALPRSATKHAAWRKRLASAKAISYAQSLGIEVPDKATGAQVSDLIDVRVASNLLGQLST